MNVRLVCVFASSSCIGTELAADVAENVESRKCDFRAVLARHFSKSVVRSTSSDTWYKSGVVLLSCFNMLQEGDISFFLVPLNRDVCVWCRAGSMLKTNAPGLTVINGVA